MFDGQSRNAFDVPPTLFGEHHMKPLHQALFLAGGILSSLVATTANVSANGGEFFLPAPEHGHVDLVYFGHIKDTDGNYLDDAEMTIHVDGIGMTFPFDNDSPG